MSRCVSLRVFSSQNSYTTSQSETPSATQAIERQRWWEQVFHHFKHTEPSNKPLSLFSLPLSLNIRRLSTVTSPKKYFLLTPSIHFSLFTLTSFLLSQFLSPSAVAAYYFLRGRVRDCQTCLVAAAYEVVSFNRKGRDTQILRLWSLCLSPFSALLRYSLAFFFFFFFSRNPSTICCRVQWFRWAEWTSQGVLVGTVRRLLQLARG